MTGSTSGLTIALTVVVLITALSVVLVRYLNALPPQRPEAPAGHTGSATAA